MRKRDEIANPDSCLNRARDDEFTFVLLARDRAAPVAIRAWIAERIRIGKNRPDDAQILEAERCAQIMEAEREPKAIDQDRPRTEGEANP
jgi:hypothetical protein